MPLSFLAQLASLLSMQVFGAPIAALLLSLDGMLGLRGWQVPFIPFFSRKFPEAKHTGNVEIVVTLKLVCGSFWRRRLLTFLGEPC